jgi:hypothetical protein
LNATRSRKPTKDKAILVSLAESIGSTLGSIAAKADATQKALTKRRMTAHVARKSKAVARRVKSTVRSVKKNKTWSRRAPHRCQTRGAAPQLT